MKSIGVYMDALNKAYPEIEHVHATLTKDGVFSGSGVLNGESISFTGEDLADFMEQAEIEWETSFAGASIVSARTAQKERIKRSWLNDISNIGMPVPGYDFAVDYDIEDYLIWSGGAGLLPAEATEVEVRSIDDTYHVIPVATYLAIPGMQMAYYAQQLQRKWALQKAIDSAETVEEIESITWEVT